MLPSRDRKDDTLSRRGLGLTFMVNMFDSQKRSCQFKWESACHSNLTCQSVTLITLICKFAFHFVTKDHPGFTPQPVYCCYFICLCIGLLNMLLWQ